MRIDSINGRVFSCCLPPLSDYASTFFPLRLVISLDGVEVKSNATEKQQHDRHVFSPHVRLPATAAVQRPLSTFYFTTPPFRDLINHVRAFTSTMASPKAFNITRSDLTGPTDCVTLITGGAAGIGLQTALLLHDICPNNKIILLDRQKPSPQQATQQFIESERVLAVQCDLTNWISQREAFEEAFRRFGHINNVFVNAGIAEYKDQFFKDDLDEQGKLKEPDRRVYDVDLAAANDTVKLAIHYMRKNKEGGNVVMTASLAGYLASAGAPLYSAAKHGSWLSFKLPPRFCPTKSCHPCVSPCRARSPCLEQP